MQQVNTRSDSIPETPELVELRRQHDSLIALRSQNPAILGAILDIKNQIKAEVNRMRVSHQINDNRIKLAAVFSEKDYWASLTEDELRQAFRAFVLEVRVDSTGNVSEVIWDF